MFEAKWPKSWIRAFQRKAGIFQSEITKMPITQWLWILGKCHSFSTRSYVCRIFARIYGNTWQRGVGGQLNLTQFVRKSGLGKLNAEARSAKIIAKLLWEGLGGLGGLGGARVGELLKFRGLPCHVVHPTPNPTHQLAKIFTLTRHSSPQNIKMRWPVSPSIFLNTLLFL